jgi:hypothetical protein
MEKRAHRRHPLSAPIVCSYLSSLRFGKTFEGNMSNCSSNGLCAELEAQFSKGTILVVRTTGCSRGSARGEGFRSLSLAEVKWSNPKPAGGGGGFATGLKYVVV